MIIEIAIMLTVALFVGGATAFILMKLEIESDKVDNLKDFKAKKHIRGVRLHFLPQSYEGKQELYEGITFEKDI